MNAIANGKIKEYPADVIATLCEYFKCDIGTLHTLGADGKLHLRAHTPGIPEPILAASRVIPVGKGIAGLAAQNKKAMNMCNLTQDSDPRIPSPPRTRT